MRAVDGYHDDVDYRDDVDSLLAQLRDVERAFGQIRRDLVPLLTRFVAGDPDASISAVVGDRAGRYPLGSGNVADAWHETGYAVEVVRRLARAAERAARDAELIHGRYAATQLSWREPT